MSQFSFKTYEDHKINYIDASVFSWSPKLDLIALGSSTGDVYVYRLHMTLVWKHSDKQDGCVISITWHPKGNIFAVLYESKLIKYFSINFQQCFYSVTLKDEVLSMSWKLIETKPHDQKLYNAYEIIPQLQNLFYNSVYKEEIKKIDELLMLDNTSSMLICNTISSIVLLSNGVFNLGHIKLNNLGIQGKDKLRSVNMTSEGKQISMLMETIPIERRFNLKLIQINCQFIEENQTKISKLSSLFIKIIHLRQLIEVQIKEVEENWEDWFHIFETFLLDNYWKKIDVPGWSFRTEFQKMVLFGFCDYRAEFWRSFDDSLAKEEVRKISDKISKMSDYIISHCCPSLHLSLMTMEFHVNEMQSLLSTPSNSYNLNISTRSVHKLAECCGCSLVKLHEFSLILREVSDNINLLFRWLSNRIDIHINQKTDADFDQFSMLERDALMEFVTNKLVPVKNSSGQVIHYEIWTFGRKMQFDTTKMPYLATAGDGELLYNHFIGEMKKEIPPDDIFFQISGLFELASDSSLSSLLKTQLPDLIDDVFGNTNNAFIQDGVNQESITQMDFAISLVNNPDESPIIVSDNFTRKKTNTDVEVCALYDPSSLVLVWTKSNYTSMSSSIIFLDKVADDERVSRVCQLQLYSEDVMFLLLSLEDDVGAERQCLLVLDWQNLVEYLTPVHRGPHGTPVWPADINRAVYLSNLPKSVELLPMDAVDISVNSNRQVAVVFFGKSHEKCRVFKFGENH